MTALILTAVAVTAQSPLTTTFANNNGGAAGGAVYFELECLDPLGVFITNIDLNFSGAGGAAGSIDVYVMEGGFQPFNGPNWAGPVSHGNVPSTNAAGTPTNVGLAPSFQLGFGCKLGVAIVANGIAHAYTTATTLPATFSTAELELTVGGGSNVPFTAPLFFPRLVNINIPYTQGGNCPQIASATPQGMGCGGLPEVASFYETWAGGAGFDLDGMILTATNTASGYNVTLAPGAGFTVPGTATMVALTDDSQAAVGTLGLSVGSNCWVATGPGNTNAFGPTVAAAINTNPSTAVYSWNDLNPAAAGSGQVFYDESGTVGTVTYDGVYSFGTTDPNFVQFTYDTSNGNFTIEWAGIPAALSSNLLVGYSPGGPNVDPGATDISAAVPFSTIAGASDLTLTAVGRPIQGNLPVPFNVTTSGIPGSAVAHIGILGLTRPGAPLNGIGMPGCFLWASLDVLYLDLLPSPAPSNFTWTSVTLPASGPFRRVYDFDLQSAIFGTAANNAFTTGAVTSNGLKCKTGKI